jgi:hypothetical protein
LSCAFLRFGLTVDPTAVVYGECLESRFTLKAGVAIPDIVRNNAVAPAIRNVRELLKVKDLLVAIQGYTGANPIITRTIKPPKSGSIQLECLPNGWTKCVHEFYLQYVFSILSKCLQQELFVGVVPDTAVQQDLTQVTNKPFFTQLSVAWPITWSRNTMRLSPPSSSLAPHAMKPNNSHLTSVNYSLQVPTQT